VRATFNTMVLDRIDRLVNWFIPVQTGVDERQFSARRMFVYICLINLVFSLLYAITSAAIGFDAGAMLMSTGVVLLLAALFYFRATGKFRLTVNWYMANCAFVAVLGCSFFSGGLQSPVAPWFTLIPVAAVLLLGYSVDALVWALVCFAIPLGYGVAGLEGYVFPKAYQLEFETIFSMICVAGLVSALFLFALAFNHNSSVAMQKVLDSRKEVERLARRQERMAERGRILRNMHDGVGSHISSAMRQLQVEGDGRDFPLRCEVLQTLRDALDQLKLSIDSIHLAPGDVTALLASMRYRLGPRFAGMGIELQWDVELLPICQSLDANAMSELQFMLFEALSNVLQHAQAHVLRVEGHARASGEMASPLDDGVAVKDRVFVRLIDDGCGFDPAVGQRNGLATMRERANTIGAQLRIASKPGRTVIEIQLVV
jgi:signal transduction histidine kinase